MTKRKKTYSEVVADNERLQSELDAARKELACQQAIRNDDIAALKKSIQDLQRHIKWLEEQLGLR